MVAVTRAVGTVLVAIGVVAYLVTGADSLTALLPALLGAILMGLGVLAGRPGMHRHAIHAALAVALLGFLGTLPRALPLLSGDELDRPAAAWASLATAIVTLVYVGLGVRSFVEARKQRSTSGA